MKLSFLDQRENLDKYLEEFKLVSTMNFDRNLLIEKVSSVKINTIKKFKNLSFQALNDYKIFPENILSSLSQWSIENRDMQCGDIIIQQIYVPPIANFSVKLICAVKIKEIFNESKRCGFSYETLEGHVERGISTFTIEQSDQELLFKIHTFSEPANLFTKLLGPIFIVPYQSMCTVAALQNIRQTITKEI